MGDDNKEEQGKVTPKREEIYDFAGNERNRLFGGQTPLEQEYIPQSQNFYNAYQRAGERQEADYGDIMGSYRDWRTGGVNPLLSQIKDRKPTQFSMRTVTPGANENEDFGAAQYRNFAETGGYSPQDIQELRARGISPIRSAYGNTQMQLDRAKSLGGAGGSPNYIAAVSRAQRELPGQLADAMTGVNAGLAESIRSGKMFGTQGITGIGEAQQGRDMQAQLANQEADLRVQQLTEQGYNSNIAQQIAAMELGLKGIEGERGLYGTTPAMAATFGNQALQAYQQRAQLENMRNQYGLGLIGTQLQALGQQAPQGKPWWQTALDIGGEFAPFFLVLSLSLRIPEILALMSGLITKV